MFVEPPPSAATFDLGGNAEPIFVCRFIKIFRRVVLEVGPADFSVTVKEKGRSRCCECRHSRRALGVLWLIEK